MAIRMGDGFTLMPRNDLNQPALANLAMGGGQSTNVYSGGVYYLQPDEALIEVVVPVEPAYMGFHLPICGASHWTTPTTHAASTDSSPNQTPTGQFAMWSARLTPECRTGSTPSATAAGT